MEFIKINYSPTLCNHSLWKRERIPLVDMTIQSLQDIIDAKVKKLQAQGMTHFLLKFDSTTDDDGETMPFCIVEGSRLETENERLARVQRQESYNDRQVREHKEKLENAARRKEIDRLTKHLTIEQLQNIQTLSN